MLEVRRRWRRGGRSSATRLRGCTLFVQRACRTTRSMRQWIGTRHVSAAGFEPVMLGCRSRAALDWCAERSGFRISPRRWDVAGAGAVMVMVPEIALFLAASIAG